MFDLLIHSDWSCDSKKRWMAEANRTSHGWMVDAPQPRAFRLRIGGTYRNLVFRRPDGAGRVRFPDWASGDILGSNEREKRLRRLSAHKNKRYSRTNCSKSFGPGLRLPLACCRPSLGCLFVLAGCVRRHSGSVGRLAMILPTDGRTR